MRKRAGKPVGTPIPGDGGLWKVPSRDGQRIYLVRLQPKPACQCSGFLFACWKLDCRHIRAVKAFLKHEGGADEPR